MPYIYIEIAEYFFDRVSQYLHNDMLMAFKVYSALCVLYIYMRYICILVYTYDCISSISLPYNILTDAYKHMYVHIYMYCTTLYTTQYTY